LQVFGASTLKWSQIPKNPTASRPWHLAILLFVGGAFSIILLLVERIPRCPSANESALMPPVYFCFWTKFWGQSGH
jgi:hypothetical protein